MFLTKKMIKILHGFPQPCPSFTLGSQIVENQRPHQYPFLDSDKVGMSGRV